MSEHIENRDLLPDGHEKAAPGPSPQLLALKDSLEARLRANDTSEIAALRARLRTTAQTLIAEVGATGPMDAEDAATRAVERIATLRAEVARLQEAIRWALGEGDEFAPRMLHQGPYWWRKELRERAALQETRHG